MEKVIPEDSWFQRFLAVWPTAEPPIPYILFSAMSVMGGCIGRKIFFDQDVHTLYPMLNLLLIGPSGIGKSTSIGMALRLVEGLPVEERPQVIKGKSTKEALHEDFVTQPHSIVVASELANFFSKEKYMEGMIPYVTQLLDYEHEVRVRTKSGGKDNCIVYDPSVTFMGGSTVEWLQEQLPSTATAGGFLPRFFIVKEEHKGKRIPNPRLMLNARQTIQLEKAREYVFNEFRAIIHSYEGVMGYADYEASDAYGIWYQTFTPSSGHLNPFAARAGEYVLRMSMLLALSCGRTAINAGDVRAAIKLHAYSIDKLQEVVVPFTPQGKLIAKVMDAIGTETMSAVQIKRAMKNYCGGRDVDRILEDLVSSRDVLFVDGTYCRIR